MRVFVAVAALGLAAAVSAGGEPDMTIEELCSYDSLCQRAVDSRGKPLPLAPALRRLVEESRDVFFDLGERYGVDPRAAIGAIVAESTMNVQASDAVQNWLAYRGITSVGGKNFTFGIGQINMDAAIEAEGHMAKIDGRPERSSSEIREALLTLDGAAYYSTGIVRKVQDDYKSRGIDISSRPEILATLYNLGKSADRAHAAAAQNKKPKVNYFGWFVANNLKDINELMGYDPEKKVRTKPRASEQLIQASDSFETSSSGTDLLTSPPMCGRDGRGDAGRYNAITTRRDFPEAQKGKGRFRVAGRGVDCDMKDYVLVQFENGVRGWMPASRLQEPDSGIRKVQSKVAMRCDSAAGQQCLTKLRDLLASHKLVTPDLKPDAENSVSLNLVTTDGKPMEKSYKESNAALCEDHASYVTSSGGSGGNVPLTPDLLAKIAAKNEDVKRIVVQKLALNGWNDYDNPVSNSLVHDSSLRDCASGEKSCSLSIYKLVSSSGNGRTYSSSSNSSAELDAFLKLDPGKMDTRDLLMHLNTINFSVYTDRGSAATGKTHGDFRAATSRALAAAEKSCAKIFEDPETAKEFAGLKKATEKVTEKNFQYLGGTTGNFIESVEGLGKKCDVLQSVLDGDFKTFRDDPIEVSAKGSTSTFRVRQVEKIDPGRESLMAGFRQSLSGMAGGLSAYMPHSDSSTESCKYDAFATASLAQKLAEENCVEQVLVPDRFALFGARGAPAKKIVYDEADEKKFRIQMKGCGTQSGSLWDSIRSTR